MKGGDKKRKGKSHANACQRYLSSGKHDRSRARRKWLHFLRQPWDQANRSRLDQCSPLVRKEAGVPLKLPPLRPSPTEVRKTLGISLNRMLKDAELRERVRREVFG